MISDRVGVLPRRKVKETRQRTPTQHHCPKIHSRMSCTEARPVISYKRANESFQKSKVGLSNQYPRCSGCKFLCSVGHFSFSLHYSFSGPRNVLSLITDTTPHSLCLQGMSSSSVIRAGKEQSRLGLDREPQPHLRVFCKSFIIASRTAAESSAPSTDHEQSAVISTIPLAHV